MIEGTNKWTLERTTHTKERTNESIRIRSFIPRSPASAPPPPPPQPGRAPQMAQPQGVTRAEPKPSLATPADLASLASLGARFRRKAIYPRENSCFRLESQNLQHCFFPVASDEKLWACLASPNFVEAFLRDKKTSDQHISCDDPLWDKVSISCSESL